MSRICSLLRKKSSLGRYCAKPRAPEPLGTMVTFSKGSACSRFQPATAWPASWNAEANVNYQRQYVAAVCMSARLPTTRFSSMVMIFLLSRPPMIRSVAFSKSTMSTFFLSLKKIIRKTNSILQKAIMNNLTYSFYKRMQQL